MTEEGLKMLVGRLVSDENFKAEFFSNRKQAVQKSGYSISEEEFQALERIKEKDFKIRWNREFEEGTFGITTIDLH
jgi:hypothetical protein